MSWSGVQVRLSLALERFDLDVEFEVEARRIGIFGASGSGKTTVLEAIAGWRTPSEGLVRLDDRVLLDTRASVSVDPARRGVGYVPQDALLFPHWNVERNLMAGSSASRGELFDRVVATLDLSPLLQRGPQSLSGGEKQRVSLGRALLSDPALLLLDEPLASLDLTLRRRILAYLARVGDAFDVPLIFVSHDPTEVQTLCEHVVVIDSGRVLAQGRPGAVLSGSRLLSTGFENVLRGDVVDEAAGTASIELAAGLGVVVPRGDLEPGDRCVFGLRADDILLSLHPLSAISARNVLPATIVGWVTDGGDVHLTARLASSEIEVSISLTPSAVEELSLATEQAIYLVFKTQSCQVLAKL